MFRLGSVLVLAIVAVAGCGAGGTPTLPATAGPSVLRAPIAPANLRETIVESADGSSAAADFSWTAPSGQVDGYYFKTIGEAANGTISSTPCDASWTRLPATPTAYELPSIESEPDAYLCAFNSAGTSPTVGFPMPAS